MRIVLDGLRGEDSIAELCGKEGIAQSLYYVRSKEFLEAGSLIYKWRREVVAARAEAQFVPAVIADALGRVHAQATIGWFDYHLWEFTIVGCRYGLPMDEDWGTEPSFYDLLEARADPDHPEHAQAVE